MDPMFLSPGLPPGLELPPLATGLLHHLPDTRHGKHEPLSPSAAAAAAAAVGPAGLTASQRGELELAAARASRVAASTRRPPSKRARPVPQHHDSDSDSGDDSDVELAKLPPEEQERLLSARLAAGANDKDARRLKR